MVSIKDVAKKAGVSTATVSNVINDSKFVRKNTREKVRASMEELNYYPNSAARILRNKKSKTLGFILPDISNFFFTEITKYLEKEIKENNYSLILSCSDELLKKEKEQIQILLSHQIDGLIIAPVRGEHSYLNKIRTERKMPIVFIDRIPEGVKGISVLSDNLKGSYRAVKHLIKKGHNKIAIISGLPGITSTTERLEGYKKALLDNGLEYNEEYVYFGDSTYQSGFKMTEKIIKNNEVSAIFAANNLMTLGAMTFLVKNNIKIPEEIAVISFDGFEWAEITYPPLTAVKQNAEEIAKKTVNKLLDEINSENFNYENRVSEIIRIDTQFNVRQST